jgi:hypothetical protein
MSRPEAKQRIPHMLIDTDFFEKPENVEAVDTFGDEAPAAIMRLILKLINEKEARMKKSQVLAMWRASGTDQGKWAEIMEYYIKCGWLVEQDEWICSVRVGKERARVEQKRSTLSANAKQKQSKSSANEQQSSSKSSDTDTDTDTGSDLDHIKLEIALPEFQEPKISKAIDRWRRHRQKIDRPFDQGALDSLQSLYAGRANELAEDIDCSITNGWKTLQAKSRDAPRPVKKSTKDTLNELYQQALAEEQNAKN